LYILNFEVFFPKKYINLIFFVIFKNAFSFSILILFRTVPGSLEGEGGGLAINEWVMGILYG
jgi:hypothetical protein